MLFITVLLLCRLPRIIPSHHSLYNTTLPSSCHLLLSQQAHPIVMAVACAGVPLLDHPAATAQFGRMYLVSSVLKRWSPGSGAGRASLLCPGARAFPCAATVHGFMGQRSFQHREFGKQKRASKNNPGGGIPGEFVMSVQKLQKIVGTRTLLENVTLGFLQGAKIGILGLNGCGKSTLMKILAGVEGEYDGDFGGGMA